MLENVKDYLNYNPDTGEFTWIKSPAKIIKVGQKAGSIDKFGYLRIKFKGKKIAAHRLAWYFVYGELPEKELDHINRIKTDNKISNLRLCTRAENITNTSKRKNCSSEHKGVCWHKRVGKWGASVRVNTILIHIGYYNTEIEAAEAYNEKVLQHYGDFAVVNILEEAA